MSWNWKHFHIAEIGIDFTGVFFLVASFQQRTQFLTTIHSKTSYVCVRTMTLIMRDIRRLPSFLDGAVRKRGRRSDSHRYPVKRQLKKPTKNASATRILAELVLDSSESDLEPDSVEDIHLDNISSYEESEANSSSLEDFY